MLTENQFNWKAVNVKTRDSKYTPKTPKTNLIWNHYVSGHEKQIQLEISASQNKRFESARPRLPV